MGCVLFINNFEHYFLQGSLVLNKNWANEEILQTSILAFYIGMGHRIRFEIKNGIQHFVITNYPLSVKQIMLHELSLGDIHCFCLYAFYTIIT